MMVDNYISILKAVKKWDIPSKLKINYTTRHATNLGKMAFLLEEERIETDPEFKKEIMYYWYDKKENWVEIVVINDKKNIRT